MPGPVKKAIIGTRDVLRGVGKVHKGLSQQESALRIPKEVTEAQRKMSPLEIIEDYNRRNAFGKTKSGEPLRASVGANLMSENQSALAKGKIPKSANVQFYPESKLLDPDALDRANDSMGMFSVREAIRPTMIDQYPLTEEMVFNIMHSPRRSGRSPKDLPSILEFDTSLAPSGSGSNQYQMMFDALKAQDDLNLAMTLSPVNKLRRLSNVMQHGLRHGDYNTTVPVVELASRGGGSKSTQLFDRPVLPGTLEDEWLARHLPRDQISELKALVPRDLIGLSVDDITGLLALREASLAGAYGPLNVRLGGASPKKGDLRLLGENEQLRQMAEGPLMRARQQDMFTSMADPRIIRNGGDIRTGIGPNVLGRQLTTEAVIDRLLRGQDAEEILEEILRTLPDPAAFKGRYADGGAVVAY